jgi:16S rRNA (cytidine1402-2'-O)-methyltransferase
MALGSNVGDAAAAVVAAAERIGRTPGILAWELSPLYRSEPAYLEEQAEFCNAVLWAEVDPALGPYDLLHVLQALEHEFGRVRTVPNGPRTLDVDIVDFEGVTSADPELLLPHPRALERDFVVTPLLDVAPGHVLADGMPVTREGVACGRVREESRVTDYTSPCHTCAASASGILSICATPIGNLGDLTLRVIEALRAADLVLAEDTRVAHGLLSHLGVRTKLERCDENTIRQRSPGIIERIRQGSRVALVSDAGMPGIADPGAHLVAAVREAGLPFEVLPGSSAVPTALVASGFVARSFYFGGFLPRKRAQIMKTLEGLAQLDAALVFFESPRRAAASLAAIAEVFAGREVVLARELTKLHEEVLRAPAPDLARQLAEREGDGNPLKGEVTLVIAPPPRQDAPRVHHDKYARPQESHS